MKIEIKVSTPKSEMTQAQSQVIRRVAGVLMAHNFEVDIQFPQEPYITATKDLLESMALA